jgi:hypothetical protein
LRFYGALLPEALKEGSHSLYCAGDKESGYKLSFSPSPQYNYIRKM